MRRTTVLATALVALAAGAAGCSGGDDAADAPTARTAVAAPSAGEGSAPAPTLAELQASLTAFTASLRKDPLAHSPRRLSALEARVDAFASQLAALEGSAGARDGEPSPSTVRELRATEAHLREYIRHGGDGDELAMQREIYRYLWSVNRLPEELGQL